MKKVKAKQPKNKGIISMDNSVLGAEPTQQADIMRGFKMATLQFKPSRLIYRNIDFSREQLRIFRKFLLGQCSKIVHLKEPFSQYHLSTKKIFDDMYLYLREINRKHIDYLSASTLGTKVDELNGMPIDSYAEFTSHFWNLIYKDPYRAEDD